MSITKTKSKGKIAELEITEEMDEKTKKQKKNE